MRYLFQLKACFFLLQAIAKYLAYDKTNNFKNKIKNILQKLRFCVKKMVSLFQNNPESSSFKIIIFFLLLSFCGVKICTLFTFFNVYFFSCFELFHDGGPYHLETSPLICRGNQWTGFYMIGTPVMLELTNFTSIPTCSLKINPFLADDSILYIRNILRTYCMI